MTARARGMRRVLAGCLLGALAACGTSTTATRPAPSPTTSPTLSPTPSPAASPVPSLTRTLSPTPSRASPKPSATQTPPSALPAALTGTVLTHLATSSRVVALTFDAGANGRGVRSILATLAASHVPATFFLTGRFVTSYPDLTAAITRSGAVLGNHTVTHPHVLSLSPAGLRAEVTGAARTITAATGRDPRPWFRFPYGEYDARTLATVNGLGYAAIGWTVDSLGWKGKAGGGSASRVVDRVLAALRPGEIVLMHVGSNPDDGSTLDADALPELVRRLRAAGYGFTTPVSLLR